MNVDEQIYNALIPLISVNMAMFTVFTYFGITWPKRKISQENVERLHKSFLGIYFREFWAWLTHPVVKFFMLIRFTPNMVTGLSILLSMLTGYLFAVGNIAWGGWMLIVSGSMDTFDGRLARETGRETSSGAYFDACVDRYSDAFVFMGLLWYFNSGLFQTTLQGTGLPWVGSAMVLVCMLLLVGTEVTSYSKAKGEASGYTTGKGLMQRPERIMFLSVFSCLNPFFRVVLANYGVQQDAVFMAGVCIMSLLVNYSAVIRIKDIFNEIKKNED